MSASGPSGPLVTFVVKDMFNLHSKTSKDFLKSFSKCYKNILM